MNNLVGAPEAAKTESEMDVTLESLLSARGDAFLHCHEYADWFDAQRRVVRNARGPLPDPEAPPDLSLLEPRR